MNPLVVCEGLRRSFDGVQAIDRLDLEIQSGEILALLGPSGCGKTTLLRLIAGFEAPEAGKIQIAGETVCGNGRWVPPERRQVGFVFQDYALFPHLTVQENIRFGLQGQDRARQAQTVKEMLHLVGLEDYGSRYPHELSGGERQRVALARALAPKPLILLLDEPFSNLDEDRRLRMRQMVRDILKRIGATAVFVTHDQEEALFMGDRVAVMQAGTIVQTAAPQLIFQQPATRFVAEFLGQSEFLPGRVQADGILTELGLLPQVVELEPETEVEICVRPDDISFHPHSQGNAFVIEREFKGAYHLYRLRLDSGKQISVMQPHTFEVAPQTRARVYLDPGHDLVVFHAGQAVPRVSAQGSIREAHLAAI
jgi:iron(III) transport system ATP-binding protein